MILSAGQPFGLLGKARSVAAFLEPTLYDEFERCFAGADKELRTRN